ncbi:MAG: hypothetical protein ACRDZZ_08200, partial [Ilumatobacteraceae bacterium]
PEPPASHESAEPTRSAAADVPTVWEASVKAGLKPFVRALFSAGSFTGNEGSTWHFSVPNAAHGKKCGEHRADVEAALSAAVGSPITIVIGEGPARGDTDDTDPIATPRSVTPPSAASPSAAAPAAADDEPIDLDELTDAPPESVLTPIDRLAQAFPGSELVADDGD